VDVRLHIKRDEPLEWPEGSETLLLAIEIGRLEKPKESYGLILQYFCDQDGVGTCPRVGLLRAPRMWFDEDAEEVKVRVI
jgi:hypothetical protein